MLRMRGDIANLIRLARQTNSLDHLCDQLEYLHEWGQNHYNEVQVDVRVGQVDVAAQDADVYIWFYSDSFPTTKDGSATMYGGLNLYQSSKTGWKWSINT